MNESKVKSEKAEERQSAVSNQPAVRREKEVSEMIFHNKTTGDKITINIQELEGSKVSVEMDFGTSLGEIDQNSIAANCAAKVMGWLNS